MDKATEHMVGLLRALADELEAGNGVALDVKIEGPRGTGFGGSVMEYTRTYALSLVIQQPRPDVSS